jgi:hypothetical protein
VFTPRIFLYIGWRNHGAIFQAPRISEKILFEESVLSLWNCDFEFINKPSLGKTVKRIVGHSSGE